METDSHLHERAEVGLVLELDFRGVCRVKDDGRGIGALCESADTNHDRIRVDLDAAHSANQIVVVLRLQVRSERKVGDLEAGRCVGVASEQRTMDITEEA